VNFAHGELLMVGMYATYLLAAHLGWHPYVSIVPVALLLFGLGALMQRTIIQPLLEADGHIQIFATVGVSTALMNLALLVFGADVLSTSVQVATGTLLLGNITVGVGPLITLLAALALVAGMHLFMTPT